MIGEDNMKLRITLLISFIFFTTVLLGKNLPQTFDKPAFYATMSSGKLEDINNELSFLNSAVTSNKEAYEGALLMEKAGLVKLPMQKLKYFKEGRIKLETALLNDNDNGEYHFLRLIIQEHAPKIVKYSAQLETDKEYIKKTFKNLQHTVQQAIVSYSKSSKILHPEDLVY